MATFDAVIAGGGFFGISLAHYLSDRFPRWKIAVIEVEEEPLMRASKHNQARLHNGYHYPRALQTAVASRKSYERFKDAWPSSIFDDFRHLYGVSREASNVSAAQFYETMVQVGAPARKLSGPENTDIFDDRFIEEAFEVDEVAFNYLELKMWAEEVLQNRRIDSFFGTRVVRVDRASTQNIAVNCGDSNFSTRFFFNATYGGIENIGGIEKELSGFFTHQATEMELVHVPDNLKQIGITVMDGPFFSVMPYPSRACHSFSHVRYTPRYWSEDSRKVKGLYESGSWAETQDVFDLMVRDASRYVPALVQTRLLEPIREIKTLVRGVKNDGRPIFFFEHRLEGCFSILGGKLDNVFDMFEFLDKRSFE